MTAALNSGLSGKDGAEVEGTCEEVSSSISWNALNLTVDQIVSFSIIGPKFLVDTRVFP